MSSLSFLKVMGTRLALVDVVTCNAVLTAIGTQARAQASWFGWSGGWMGETDSTWFLKCPSLQKTEAQKIEKHGGQTADSMFGFKEHVFFCVSLPLALVCADAKFLS